MLERFAGPDGGRLLFDAVMSQALVQGSEEAARELADVAELISCQIGDILLEQGAADNDLYLILAGSLSIEVNGREVARRTAQQHVGEMALIDPKSPRSASAIAREETVLARISEPQFAAIADRFPYLWRRIASQLADRLRQRNELVRQRNAQPRIFVGSSTETLDIANAIQSGLAHDPFLVTVWTNGVFGPSDFSIEALERVATETDFAILVLGPDDHVTSRDVNQLAPRDNVILELGLFIGALGRDRVFLVLHEGGDVKIPNDLLGVTPLTYSPGGAKDLSARLGATCSQLRSVMNARGPR